jgi:adenylate cyclase
VPRQILIVDDDTDLSELLREVLVLAGYVVHGVFTGEGALRATYRSRPDLILLDLMLPDMNGFSICEQLRLDPATSRIPIVIMTALPGELPRLAGIEMGAMDYLHKPFDPAEVVERIDSILEPALRRVGREMASWSSSSRARVPAGVAGTSL